jgi:hypothetical protein
VAVATRNSVNLFSPQLGVRASGSQPIADRGKTLVGLGRDVSARLDQNPQEGGLHAP